MLAPSDRVCVLPEHAIVRLATHQKSVRLAKHIIPTHRRPLLESEKLNRRSRCVREGTPRHTNAMASDQ